MHYRSRNMDVVAQPSLYITQMSVMMLESGLGISHLLIGVVYFPVVFVCSFHNGPGNCINRYTTTHAVNYDVPSVSFKMFHYKTGTQITTACVVWVLW